MSSILTAEEIAKATDHTDGQANIDGINAMYLDQDESHLWPINGEFNVTEKAIKMALVYAHANGPLYGLEYCYYLEHLQSLIVNSF